MILHCFCIITQIEVSIAELTVYGGKSSQIVSSGLNCRLEESENCIIYDKLSLSQYVMQHVAD
jgi:hypothetical protein